MTYDSPHHQETQKRSAFADPGQFRGKRRRCRGAHVALSFGCLGLIAETKNVELKNPDSEHPTFWKLFYGFFCIFKTFFLKDVRQSYEIPGNVVVRFLLVDWSPNLGQAGPAPNLGWPHLLDRALQERRSDLWKTHLRAVEYTTWFWLQRTMGDDMMLIVGWWPRRWWRRCWWMLMMMKKMLLMNVDDEEEEEKDRNQDSSITMLIKLCLLRLWIQIIHTLESPLHRLPRSQLWYELVIKKTTPDEWKHYSFLEWQKNQKIIAHLCETQSLLDWWIYVNLFFAFFCPFICCLHPMWLGTFDSMDCLRCCGDFLVG